MILFTLACCCAVLGGGGGVTVPMDFHSNLMDYTREGYRVLALAWRPLEVPYTRARRISRDRVERQLLFLGFLVMENRLKPESAPIINTLQRAAIRPIMVTGKDVCLHMFVPSSSPQLTVFLLHHVCLLFFTDCSMVSVSILQPECQLLQDSLNH